MHGQQRSRKKTHRSRAKKVKRDKHHPYPLSRKRKGDLGKFKPLLRSLRLNRREKTHSAWHHLFLNLFAEEVILLIKEVFRNNDHSVSAIISFVKNKICNNRAVPEATKADLNAWEKIFNSYWSWRKIKKVIKKEWMYPGVKAIVSEGRITSVMIFLKNVPKKTRLIENIYRCRDIQVIPLKNGTLLKLI